MISYTTVEYYTDKYLMGRQAVINTAVFPFYAQKATQMIKRYTFDNVNENEPYIDELQMCCCELSEYLYNTEKQDKNLPVGISSEKVGEHSISYETGQSVDKMRKDATKGIIYNWLANTGYLYRGC